MGRSRGWGGGFWCAGGAAGHRLTLLTPNATSVGHAGAVISLTTKDQRFAALAAALARAAVAGEVAVADAGRVIRHELRQRNKKRALTAPRRSVDAQTVIDRYTAAGRKIPTNDSPEALHSDHVFAPTNDVLATLLTQAAWLEALPSFDLVVCVTAAENYVLERFERAGASGWAKYRTAGIELTEPVPG